MAEDGASVIEAEMWETADTLRGSMDTAEYKYMVLGLMFLKYISDAFEEARAKLKSENADPEDPDEYRRQNIFWVPPEGRWSVITAQARQAAIGRIVDDAMASVERENPVIRDVLPKNYAKPSLDKTRLGSVIDFIGNMWAGDGRSRSKDVPGRVYEYFLAKFVGAEGKKGGELYTPRSVVGLLVRMLRPYNGRVYDPCCGSAGMLVQSAEFIRAAGNGGRTRADVSVYGQESNHAAWQLAKMNVAMRGIDTGQIVCGSSFHNDLHPDLKADFILANPPFSVSDWGGERLQEDRRWIYGTPPKGNANFAWVQHIVHHLAPSGTAGFVLANGSMSSNQSGECEIRRRLVEAGLVDCMVALPGQLFYSTQIPACLWFLSKNRAESRRDDILFIDARRMGRMADHIHRELSDDDISRIAGTYRAWLGDPKAGRYVDTPGFCKSAKTEEVRKRGHVLAPDRYVGAEHQNDGESFESKMSKLVAQWEEQRTEAKRLDSAIRENMKILGFESGRDMA